MRRAVLVSLVAATSLLVTSNAFGFAVELTCDVGIVKVGSPSFDSQTLQSPGNGKAFNLLGNVDYSESISSSHVLRRQHTTLTYAPRPCRQPGSTLPLIQHPWQQRRQ